MNSLVNWYVSNDSLTFDDIQIIPLYSEVTSRSDVNTRSRFTKNTFMDVPLVSSPMDTITEEVMAITMNTMGGVGILHRFCSIERQCEMMTTVKYGITKRVPVAAAVGATGDYLERAVELHKSGVRVILIDVAHGHHVNVKNALTAIKASSIGGKVDVIAGAVATAVGAYDLCEWGADAVRVGVGGGSVCETRIRTGVGVPQVTALYECVEVADRFDIPVMADGGMKTPGCVAKAIALGAESCWFGSLLSGTKETPGPFQKVGEWPNEQLFKQYRGSASLSQKSHQGQSGSGPYPMAKNVEGNSTLVPFKGKAERIVGDILDGLRSSMSYVGAETITEFQAKARFIRVTNAGMIEARPHLLLK